MWHALVVVFAILAFLFAVLPLDLVWRGYKNLRDTWTGKSKNIKLNDI
ncbi:MAG: hypothetical protein ACXVZX_11580 [Terriglobales bacterium]